MLDCRLAPAACAVVLRTVAARATIGHHPPEPEGRVAAPHLDGAPWRGEAVLQCPGLAAGAYLLSVRDASGWGIVSVALMSE